jgi:Leucine-rich repeat (LRR) protein
MYNYYVGREAISISGLNRANRRYIFIRSLYRPCELARAIYLPLLRNLRELDISGELRVNPAILTRLTRLVSLNISFNPYITYVNCPSLQHLEARCFSTFICGLTQEGITNLPNLKSIDITDNSRIHCLNHLPTLERVIARRNSAIRDDSLHRLTNLSYLDISGNHKVTVLNHLSKLEELLANETQIQKDSISSLKLRKLEIDMNTHIDRLDFLRDTLRILSVRGYCNVSLAGLKLTELYADNNPYICDLKNFPLVKLEASGDCGVDNRSLEGLYLSYLDISYNPKVSDKSLLTRVKRLVARNNPHFR